MIKHQIRVRINLSLGSRDFNISAPHIWNSFPINIRKIQSVSTCRRHLKTHFFQSAFSTSINLPDMDPDSFKILAFYNSFTYLLTYLLTYNWRGGQYSVSSHSVSNKNKLYNACTHVFVDFHTILLIDLQGYGPAAQTYIANIIVTDRKMLLSAMLSAFSCNGRITGYSGRWTHNFSHKFNSQPWHCQVISEIITVFRG